MPTHSTGTNLMSIATYIKISTMLLVMLPWRDAPDGSAAFEMELSGILSILPYPTGSFFFKASNVAFTCKAILILL